MDKHTIAAIKHVSETSYFLLRILKHMRTNNVDRATSPNTNVIMTS